jgi:predicted nucleic acid-binding protein
LVGSPAAGAISERLARDEEQLAPHLIDVEVFSAIRKHQLRGRLDATAAQQAVTHLRDWPGERMGHRLFLRRAWELRDTVRGADALYVALAEVVGGTLLTTDARLARATGPECAIEALPPKP